MANILICDDERDIVSALKIYLSGEGYTLFEAYTGREALDIVAKNDIHLILMDVMMPQMDGISATAKLRETCNIPIILLTAKSEDMDKVLGLNVGADDYITKPFNPIEVLARVRSQLRRYTTLGGMEQKPSKLIIGGIALDDDAKAVTVDGEPVSLTPIEYKLLCVLAHNVGKVLTHTSLTQKVWGSTQENDIASLRVYMASLRKKLERCPDAPHLIQTHVGIGYRMLRAENDEA